MKPIGAKQDFLSVGGKAFPLNNGGSDDLFNNIGVAHHE